MNRSSCCRFVLCAIVGALSCSLPAASFAADAAPDYEQQIAPLFRKYCNGCHNADDLEGGLSLETFAALQAGGDNGPALLPGEGKSSRLVRMLAGEAKPKMPPKDSPAPTAEEITLLRKWIDAGAKGPNGAEPARLALVVPSIKPTRELPRPVTALAYSPDGTLIAIGRYGTVDIVTADKLAPVRTLDKLPGKVTSLEFSKNGEQLIAASGITGLFGQATIWNVPDGAVVRQIEGHRDILYAAALSPDGQMLATAGYDRQIMLWNVATGELLRTLKGHNDAIYDLAFHPDGTILASAGGDQTIKLWLVATGERLDTLSQPLKEQYVVTFSPDGNLIAAAGVDNRIRVWRLVSRTAPKINPILHARFAHEGAVVQLLFSGDGQSLVSVGDDRLIKLWETRGFTQTSAYEPQPDVIAAAALAPDGKNLMIGRMDGSLQGYPVTPAVAATPEQTATPVNAAPATGEMTTTAEQEPNSALETAQQITLPATVTGVVRAAEGTTTADVDYFRFEAKAGQTWVFEVDAARSKSPLDSKLAVFSEDGKPVPRLLLQATRDSYITFRGVDSNSRDCRLHNWEEMRLNEYVYLQGEVVKLFLAPRGPDSGFSFYPHEGNRRGYFDTSAITHAVNEPCFIVEPHAPGTTLIPNGLPVFRLNYENDDDGLRKWGTDSRLHFTAPQDGNYLLRVTDVRGFQGDNFTYTLTARPAKPDFTVALQGATPSVGVGSGKEFSVTATRLDGFDGEIRVDIEGVPPGFEVTTPLVIQAGQDVARGTLIARSDAPALTAETAAATRVTATAVVDGQMVTREVNSFGEIKLAEKPKLLVSIVAADAPPAGAADPAATPPAPLELTIAPGETISAKVRIERNGFEGRVQFEAINHNLPHGVIVDNIGLNGLMIVEGQTERVFYLTAADWVPETTRTFHLVSKEEGGQASAPILIHVRKPAQTAGR